MWLVSEVRGNHEDDDYDNREHRRPDAHHEQDLGACASGTFAQQRAEDTAEACCQHRRSGVDGQQQCEDKRDAEKRVHLVLPAQLPFLFLDQAIEFVEQLSISFADRIDNAGEHWFNLVCPVT